MKPRRQCAWVVSFVASCSLVGCLPSTAAPDDAADDPAPVVMDEPADGGEATDEGGRPTIIEPDEDVMATMTCVPFDDAQLADLSRFGVFDRAVSVAVGEKDDTMWWVVAADQMRADGIGYARSAWLTDTPYSQTASTEEYGTWIELSSSDPWKNVDWDEERLVRAESALEVARAGLSEL